MKEVINILMLALASLSFCSGDRPPLLSKHLWGTVGAHLDPKRDVKLLLTSQKLSKISAYENVKGKVCAENQKKWGFLKHFETGEIFVENDFKILPWKWNKPAREAEAYAQLHPEKKPFICCLAHCFDLNELVLTALQRGYVDLIEYLLEANVDMKDRLENRDWRGRTPLLSACHFKRDDLARALIQIGSDVHAKDRHNDTALHEAARWRNVEIVRILVKAGSDVNVKNERGNTPLHEAARCILDKIRYSVETVRVLIEVGADKDAENQSGNTALHLATCHRNVEIVQILVAEGAKKDLKNNHGATALEIARNIGSTEIAALLLKEN